MLYVIEKEGLDKKIMLVDAILDSLKEFEGHFTELKTEGTIFMTTFNERLDKLIEARTK